MNNILLEVNTERKRQDQKWGGAHHDDQHSTRDFVQLIEDYAGWARVMAGMNSSDKARKRLIQVAALAVASIESIDRQADATLKDLLSLVCLFVDVEEISGWTNNQKELARDYASCVHLNASDSDVAVPVKPGFLPECSITEGLWE